MPIKKSKFNPAWLTSKWFLAVILIIIFFLGTSLVKEFYRSYQINKEITLLQQKIDSLETDNKEISEFVEYLKTDRYFQEQARLKFGLKSPGEKVIIVRDTGVESLEKEESLFNFSDPNKKQKTNPSKWLAYFFSAKN